MFLLDQGHDKVKSGIILLDKATKAILEATGASTKSMVVMAQAFGIAAGATDVFPTAVSSNSSRPIFSNLRSGKYRNAHQRKPLTRPAVFISHGG